PPSPESGLGKNEDVIAADRLGVLTAAAEDHADALDLARGRRAQQAGDRQHAAGTVAQRDVQLRLAAERARQSLRDPLAVADEVLDAGYPPRPASAAAEAVGTAASCRAAGPGGQAAAACHRDRAAVRRHRCLR